MVPKPSKITKSMYQSDGTNAGRLSRYQNLKLITNEDGITYIESPEKFTIKETNEDSFYSVEPAVENRLDLISYMFYKTPLLWWAIAVVNKIQNPMDCRVGLVLRIPTLDSINSSGAM